MFGKKECTKCKCIKSYFGFYRDRENADGLYYWCKVCILKARKSQYRKNADKKKAYSKEYYAKNREEVKVRSRKYRADNIDKCKIHGKKYRDENKEFVKALNKKWHKENPDKVRANRQRRRAKKLNAKDSFIDQDIQVLLAAQKNKCAKCKKRFLTRDDPKWRRGHPDSMTVDHIIPLISNGRNGIMNLQLLCRSCNSSKNVKTVDYRTKKMKKVIFKQQEIF